MTLSYHLMGSLSFNKTWIIYLIWHHRAVNSKTNGENPKKQIIELYIVYLTPPTHHSPHFLPGPGLADFASCAVSWIFRHRGHLVYRELRHRGHLVYRELRRRGHLVYRELRHRGHLVYRELRENRILLAFFYRLPV